MHREDVHRGDEDGATLLGVLLAHYSEARDDERTAAGVEAALVTGVIALLGAALAFVATREESVGAVLEEIDGRLLLGALVVPYGLAALFVVHGARSSFRHHYLRDLERAIHQQLASGAGTDHLLAPVELESQLVGLRRARRHNLPFRLVTGIAVGSAVLVVALVATALLAALPDGYLALALTAGAALAAPLVALAWSSLARGRRLYAAGVESFQQRKRPAGPHSLGGYLLLPRLEDLQKGLFLVAGVLLAVHLGGWRAPGGAVLGVLAVSWLVLEFLAFQARYQWNDIRGRAGEADDPHAARRRRLPVHEVGEAAAVRASVLVALVRLGLALAICRVDPYGVGGVLTLGVGAIWALAVAYEVARSSDAVRPVLGLVLLGYPLRFLLGFTVASTALPASVPAARGPVLVGLVITAVGLCALGAVFVGCTWTLKAVGEEQDAAVVPPQRAVLLADLRRPSPARFGIRSQQSPVRGRYPLVGRLPRVGFVQSGLLLATASLVAGVAAVSGSPRAAVVGPTALATVASVVLAWRPLPVLRRAAGQVLVNASAVLALGVLLGGAGLLAALAAGVAGGVYVFFRSRPDFYSLTTVRQDGRRLLGVSWHWFARTVVGAGAAGADADGARDGGTAAPTQGGPHGDRGRARVDRPGFGGDPAPRR